jgi:predicted phage terminase large subunit-like protein
MDLKQVENYVKDIIPKIEEELSDNTKEPEELVELYSLYVDILRLVAPHDFISFQKYLELDDDHDSPNKAFYYHRKDVLGEMFEALNDMEIYDKYDIILVSMPPRIGKEQPLYSKILTPTGWETMGDMVVGKKVIGSDGMSHNVIGVFPQGLKDVYTVTFDDGSKVECGLEHLWTVQTRDDRRKNKTRTITTEQMMKNLYVEGGKRKNYSINYVKPVEYSGVLADDDLKPYLLGALLGDGSFVDGSVKFTNIDQDIIDRVASELPDTDMIGAIQGITYPIIKADQKTRTNMGYSIPSKTVGKIREYGLYKKKSNDKFIPKQYLYTGVENRFHLLQGLMDTDGSNNGDSSYLEYTTVSKQLALDFIELVRGLGARATLVEKETGKQLAYRIIFNMELNPFYCKRKYDSFTPRTTRKSKYVTSIDLTGKELCQCIMVDAPDNLYVTDGYNLTHNTTTGIRFLSWIIGRYPEESQMGTSYSDNITTSFYIGVMELVQSDRYKEVFPDAKLINQNAKREEIWLKVMRRYPSITFVPIGGSMTGRCEATRYLYCDDLVSGIEEALSLPRLNKLWQMYTVNARQRKKDRCKEIHIATKWSVHDVINKLGQEHADNPRCKIINYSCYDDEGESRFDFIGGFSTEYYKDQERSMDSLSFSALYLQKAIEREGILYNTEDLQYYFELPEERPDAIIAVCDSKNLGKDHVAMPIGYVYGEMVYIEDVVYNSGLPDITRPLVADTVIEHGVERLDIELNNGGNYYAETIQALLKSRGNKTSMRLFFSGNNKLIKIITYSDFVKTNFVFRHKSTYAPNSEYAKFIDHLTTWTQSGKNPFDDAPDSLAMLAQLYQDLTGMSIKILKRRELGI